MKKRGLPAIQVNVIGGQMPLRRIFLIPGARICIYRPEGDITTQISVTARQLACRKANVARASKPKIGRSPVLSAQRSRAPPLNRLK